MTDYISAEIETDRLIDESIDAAGGETGTGVHTLAEDFAHFLSYSGLWREDEETRAKLWEAFKAGSTGRKNDNT